MVRDHVKIAWRSLLQQRQYSLINVTGLAVGLCCVIFVTLYVREERSYDRFYDGADRIFRVTRIETNSNGQSEHQARTVKAIAFTLRRDFPEVEAAAAILQLPQQVVRSNDKQFYEGRVLEADSNFFRVFDSRFIQGSPDDVLKTKQSIVITRSAALKYFGTLEVIGKPIRCANNEYFIDGVTEDVPSNSHFHYDFLVPLRTFEAEHDTEWQGMRGYHTYVKLNDNANATSFEEKLQHAAREYDPPSKDQYFIQNLTDIHLTSKLKGELEQNGDEGTLEILTGIALIVMLVASINYVNLATARSVKRAKEIGVRKTSGANRGILVRQFLTESLLTTMISFALAVVLMIMSLPFFENITGKPFTIFSKDLLGMWMLLLAISFMIGLISGAYPALYLSAIDPVNVLKANVTIPFVGAMMRRTLVLFQFAISIGLLIGTITMIRQLDFMLDKSPGFDKDHVIVIGNAGNIPGRSTLEQSISQLAGVEAVGASTSMPGIPAWTTSIRADHSQADRLINFSQVDYEYINALGIRLLDGRNFSRQFPVDTINTIILNETAVRELGLTDPVGQRLIWDEGGRDTTLYATVVGVVSDFHYASFHEPIQPFAFLVRNNFFVAEDFTSRLFVRTSSDPTEVVHDVEGVWKKFVPERPFTYSFMDDNFKQWHEPERKFKNVFMLFTTLSVFIAGMGLSGLISFMSERRRKEIGIRKVLGASAASIVALLSTDFMKLIAIAIVVATPLGWYAMNAWLAGFAYRISIGAMMLIVPGVAVILVTMIVVTVQSLRSATADPVKALRAE